MNQKKNGENGKKQNEQQDKTGNRSGCPGKSRQNA